MPSAVKPFRIAARIWISATCRSKSRAERHWPSNFTQCILVSTRLRRWYPVSCRHNALPRYFEDRTASFRALAPGVSGFQSLAFLRGGMTAWALRAAMASWHLRVSYAPSAVTLPISSSGGIWLIKSGSTGASPILLLVASIARISSVCSSIPICIFLQRRRFDPPCLRAFHSPSPSALMPVLSIRRCSGPADPRYGRATVNVLCRRHNVLKSGTAQSSPTNLSRLSTNPVVCLKGRLNKTLRVRQA